MGWLHVIAERLGGLAVVTALGAAPVAQTSWLAVCDRAPAEKRPHQVEYLEPGGGKRVLTVSGERSPEAGCVQVEAPFPAEAIAWAAVIPTTLAPSLQRGMILQGVETGGRFEPGEVYAPETSPAPGTRTLVPLDTDLLARLEVLPFGREERVTAHAGGGKIVLTARKGAAPAGVILRGGPWRLPENADLVLQVTAAGAGSYEWAVSDARRAEAGTPLPLGALRAEGTARAQELSIPAAGLDRRSWASLSVVAPPEGGRLELSALRLALRPRAGAAPGRSAWAWQPALWLDTPDVLLARLRKQGATTVYLTVPVSPEGPSVRHSEELQSFVRRAGAEKIRVWAVDGDPAAVLPGEREKFVQRARAYAAYNAAVDPPGRLAGVQYDIEPYLLRGYNLNPEGWHRLYLQTLESLKAAAGMPLEAVLPFWFASQQAEGKPLLEALARHVDAVTVMDYRTDPAAILEHAEPFLAWGARTGKTVRIALEAGPIPDEQRRHYEPAMSGELWLTRVGEYAVLVLLKQPQEKGLGTAFRYTRTSDAPGAKITFHKDKEGLLQLLPRLEAQLSAWSSFSGVALHELD